MRMYRAYDSPEQKQLEERHLDEPNEKEQRNSKTDVESKSKKK